MSSCCKPQSVPEVIFACDRPSAPWSVDVQGSEKLYTTLLDEPSSSSSRSRTPSSPFVDLKVLLTDMVNRQEELFSQIQQNQNLLHHQLENQLSKMQSASEAHADAQEKIFGELRKFLATPNGSRMNKKGQKEGMAQSQTPEFGGNSNTDAKTAITESVNTLASSESHDVNKKSRAQESSFSEPLSVALPFAEPPVELPLAQTLGKQKKPGRFSALNPTQNHVSLNGQHGMQTRINDWLQCKEVEFAIALAILTNAFIMCAEVQYRGLDVGFSLRYRSREVEAHVVWPGAAAVFTVFDWLFGILFCLELLLKLACWRFKYFYDRDKKQRHSRPQNDSCLSYVQGWNILDLLSVVGFLLDKLTPIITVNVNDFNPQTLRLVRLVRIFRLIRLLRFVETLDNLYVMTTAIAGLSQVLSWAVVLLTLMLLTCNLCLVQLLQVTYFDQVSISDLTEDSLKRHQEVYKYFGTCTRCMLSMFEITLGNWPPIARLLVEEVSEWFAPVCIAHKLTIGFAVVGVITGVILQETFKVAQTDDIIMLRQRKKASRVLAGKMKRLFETLDKDPDGKLQVGEFMSILSIDPNMKFWLESLDIETDNLALLFELIDVDGSGYITVDELVTRVPRIRGAARSIDVLDIMRNHLDINE